MVRLDDSGKVFEAGRKNDAANHEGRGRLAVKQIGKLGRQTGQERRAETCRQADRADRRLAV
jgi:hypothetical protein